MSNLTKNIVKYILSEKQIKKARIRKAHLTVKSKDITHRPYNKNVSKSTESGLVAKCKQGPGNTSSIAPSGIQIPHCSQPSSDFWHQFSACQGLTKIFPAKMSGFFGIYFLFHNINPCLLRNAEQQPGWNNMV